MLGRKTECRDFTRAAYSGDNPPWRRQSPDHEQRKLATKVEVAGKSRSRKTMPVQVRPPAFSLERITVSNPTAFAVGFWETESPCLLAREIRKEIYVILAIIPKNTSPSSWLYGPALNSLVGIETVCRA